jgi:hypothetical protein
MPTSPAGHLSHNNSISATMLLVKQDTCSVTRAMKDVLHGSVFEGVSRPPASKLKTNKIIC